MIQIVHETVRDLMAGKVGRAVQGNNPTVFKMNPYDRDELFGKFLILDECTIINNYWTRLSKIS